MAKNKDAQKPQTADVEAEAAAAPPCACHAVPDTVETAAAPTPPGPALRAGIYLAVAVVALSVGTAAGLIALHSHPQHVTLVIQDSGFTPGFGGGVQPYDPWVGIPVGPGADGSSDIFEVPESGSAPGGTEEWRSDGRDGQGVTPDVAPESHGQFKKAPTPKE